MNRSLKNFLIATVNFLSSVRFIQNTVNYFFKLLAQFKNLSSRGCIGPGRFLNILDSDYFIVSYPKSGNTWVRFIVANMIHRDKTVLFSNIEDLVPDVYINKESSYRELATPRFFKSHEYFDPRMKNVIYIVRDPRDVMVSLFFYLKKIKSIKKSYDLDLFVSNMLRGDYDSKFGSWGDNVGSWYGSKNKSRRILFIKYESLLKKPEYEYARIAKFIGKKFSQLELQEIISKTSFTNMSNLEKIDKSWVPNKNSDKSIGFVRSGKDGEGSKILKSETQEIIISTWKEQIKQAGYKFNSENII